MKLDSMDYLSLQVTTYSAATGNPLVKCTILTASGGSDCRAFHAFVLHALMPLLELTSLYVLCLGDDGILLPRRVTSLNLAEFNLDGLLILVHIY